jgi:hypothetical protein
MAEAIPLTFSECLLAFVEGIVYERIGLAFQAPAIPLPEMNDHIIVAPSLCHHTGSPVRLVCLGVANSHAGSCSYRLLEPSGQRCHIIAVGVVFNSFAPVRVRPADDHILALEPCHDSFQFWPLRQTDTFIPNSIVLPWMFVIAAAVPSSKEVSPNSLHKQVTHLSHYVLRRAGTEGLIGLFTEKCESSDPRLEYSGR